MNLREFLKQAKPSGEKNHQNDDLLKKAKTTWVPRKSLIKEDATNHKVRVHFDGRTEIRYVNDKELENLHSSGHITKVEHLGKADHTGRLMESVETEKKYEHPDGRKASVSEYKYADSKLGTDHYVHLPDTRGTVFDSHEKAHKLLSKLGYKESK